MDPNSVMILPQVHLRNSLVLLRSFEAPVAYDDRLHERLWSLTDRAVTTP